MATEFIEWRDEIWRRRLWAWYQQKQIPKTPRTPKPDRGSIRYLTGGKHILRRPDDDSKRKRRLKSRAKHAARHAQRCKPRRVRMLKGEKVEGKFQREKWPTMGYQTIDKISRMTEQGRRTQRRYLRKNGPDLVDSIKKGIRALAV